MEKKSNNLKICLIMGVIVIIIAIIASLFDNGSTSEIVEESDRYQEEITSVQESSNIEESSDVEEDTDNEENNDTDEISKQLDFENIIDYYDDMAYESSNEEVQIEINGDYFMKEVEVEVTLTNLEKSEYLESYEIRKRVGSVSEDAKNIMEGINDSLKNIGIENVKMKTTIVDMYGQRLTGFSYSDY